MYLVCSMTCDGQPVDRDSKRQLWEISWRCSLVLHEKHSRRAHPKSIQCTCPYLGKQSYIGKAALGNVRVINQMKSDRLDKLMAAQSITNNRPLDFGLCQERLYAFFPEWFGKRKEATQERMGSNRYHRLPR